jgi:pyridoxal phosphate enzyme (YggS family)
MAIDEAAYRLVLQELSGRHVTLVAVSKTKPVTDIQQLYSLGQRDFGENYVQELTEKQPQLPGDIRWHFIGHLQSNKVKYIAPFVHMIHGVDSLNLLKEIQKQAAKNNRTIDCLLQVHVAMEETKFGLDEGELSSLVQYISQHRNDFPNLRIRGVMGMASFTDNTNQVRDEFKTIKKLFSQTQPQLSSLYAFDTLSMGMSGDYAIAIEEGSTLVRIGSLLFGKRQ